MTYKFKTNINCSGCVAKVTPFLEANNQIKSWHVDTASPYKILTIETDELTPDMMKVIVNNAGYNAEEFSATP